MRVTAIILATVIGFVSESAFADIVRHASIPQSLRGTWAANPDECSGAGTSTMILLANKYVGSEGSCVVDWVDETPGVYAPNYSAHLRCAGTGSQQKRTISNIILRQNDASHILAGADFGMLKTYQRCSTNVHR